jgi:hypothetical protein
MDELAVFAFGVALGKRGLEGSGGRIVKCRGWPSNSSGPKLGTRDGGEAWQNLFIGPRDADVI